MRDFYDFFKSLYDSDQNEISKKQEDEGGLLTSPPPREREALTP